jgi:hypothetical protein
MLGFKRFETAAVTIRGIELAVKIIDPCIENATWHTAFERLQSRFSEVMSQFQCTDQ